MSSSVKDLDVQVDWKEFGKEEYLLPVTGDEQVYDEEPRRDHYREPCRVTREIRQRSR